MSASADLKPDWGEVRIISRWIVFITVIGILFTIAVMMAGCVAAPRSIAASTSVTSRPCVTNPLGPRPTIISIVPPEKFPYEGPDGEPGLAMRITVDPDSMIRFYDYLTSLEAVVEAAQRCTAR